MSDMSVTLLHVTCTQTPDTAVQQMGDLDSEFLEIPIVDIRKYLDGRLTHATCVTLSQLGHVTRVNDTVIIMSDTRVSLCTCWPDNL